MKRSVLVAIQKITLQTALLSVIILVTIIFPTLLIATDYNVDPSNYRNYLTTLQPGDTLKLAAGQYSGGLSITDLVGTTEAPITVTGPESGEAAILLGNAARNTVSIRRSAHIVLRYLTIDGQNISYIDAVKAEGDSGNWTHHITIEHCTITGHDANQYTVGISTKAPSWDWVIRHNVVYSAGTGLYLGNSNGEAPFIRGLIEYNLIQNPVGYCMQIKHQNPRPTLPDMPSDGSVTIVRHNVFVKDDDPSERGDRPNLLVGHFPVSGTGAGDRYEIYGNFFYHNPRESLFQGEGNIHLHDNVFVDSGSGWPAINIRPHNDLPKEIAIYNNTIFGADTGITVTGVDSGFSQMVIGNVIFADTPFNLTSSVTAVENLTGDIAQAATYFTNSSLTLGQLDLYPLPGQFIDTDISGLLTTVTGDTDHGRDFNGFTKDFTYRGAYQGGAGSNPGWQLNAEIKDDSENFDLADGIRVLQVVAGMESAGINLYDANGDGYTGLAEVITFLRKQSGLPVD